MHSHPTLVFTPDDLDYPDDDNQRYGSKQAQKDRGRDILGQILVVHCPTYVGVSFDLIDVFLDPVVVVFVLVPLRDGFDLLYRQVLVFVTFGLPRVRG